MPDTGSQELSLPSVTPAVSDAPPLDTPEDLRLEHPNFTPLDIHNESIHTDDIPMPFIQSTPQRAEQSALIQSLQEMARQQIEQEDMSTPMTQADHLNAVPKKPNKINTSIHKIFGKVKHVGLALLALLSMGAFRGLKSERRQ